MNKILVAMAACADDSILAERALDWIGTLNNKKSRGHILIAYASDLHQEMRIRLRISAEIAFETVSEISLSAPSPASQPNKTDQINSAFRQVAAHIQSHYRWPWLFFEPDCIPLKPNWLEVLADAYDSQAKRFCGSLMASPDGKLLGMYRVGIYSPAASSELERFFGNPNVGFEYAAGEHVVPRCTKTKLIQQFPITDDSSLQKIRPDAVLLHSDKWGKVIKKLKAERPMSNGEFCKSLLESAAPIGAAPSRALTVNDIRKVAELGVEIIPAKPDLRTKAGRALKAAKKSTPLQTV